MEIKQEIAQVQKRPETFADIRKDAEARFRELVEAWMQRRSTFQTTLGAMQAFNSVFDRLEAAHKRERTIDENTSDGYHTFQELYRYRMLYNTAFFNMLARHTDIPVVKSRRHGDGEPCFGGGWFIVMAQLPTGQVSNHYEDRYWDLFYVPEAEKAPVWDGHTPNDAADRLELFLEMRELLIKSTENVNSASISDSRDNCGDSARLREALEFCVKGMCGFCRMDAEARGMSTRCVHGCEALLKAKAALAAPPRNCDRPECATTKAAQDVWRKEDGGKTAYYEWLLATYKKGDNNGNE